MCEKVKAHVYLQYYSPKRIAAGSPGRRARQGKTNTFTRGLAHASEDVSLSVYNFRQTSIFHISFYFTYMSVFDCVMAGFATGWHG